MENIIIPAEDVWDFASENYQKLLGSAVLIAENDNFGISVYITLEPNDDLYVIVAEDAEELAHECLYNRYTCEDIIQEIYEGFVYQDTACNEAEEFGPTHRDIVSDIEEREWEIHDAARKFLKVVCDQEFYDYEVEEIVDCILELLVEEYDAEIYRPMILTDENGEEYITDYPYEIEDDFFDEGEDDEEFEWEDER